MKRGFLNAQQKSSNQKVVHREMITDETELLNFKMKSLSCSCSSSSAASIIGNSVDIFTLILLCLPVKPLLVFKSVSKQWLSVISDPIFIKKHTQKQYPHSVMVETPKKLEFVSLDGSSSFVSPFETLGFLKEPHIRIKQSCNGLLCCCSHKGDVASRKCTYYICNPSTKQYRKIVCGFERATEKGYTMLLNVSLAYEPLKSPHYKVICVWMMPPLEHTQRLCAYLIEIYSSETNSWKLAGDVFSIPRSIFSKSGVYWNGSLHWIDSWPQENHIRFNVDQELRTGIPPYRSLIYQKDRSNVEYFGECRGQLHLIADYDRLSIYDILEMKTDYSGWMHKFRVNVREFPYPVVYGGFCVLHVEEVGESFRLVMKILEQVISCDLGEMSFKDLYRFAPQASKKISQDSSYQYIETLASV
ncbi:hypothetical protein MKW92_052652 [Papaver armeniacum]|nr:hypothetical protein MKW92_052652 [Papaver armeniacum]